MRTLPVLLWDPHLSNVGHFEKTLIGQTNDIVMAVYWFVPERSV